MHTLDETVAKIAEQTTTVASMKVFIDDLKARASAVPGLTPAQQAAVDAIFDGATANTQAISDAIVFGCDGRERPASRERTPGHADDLIGNPQRAPSRKGRRYH